MGHLDFAWRQSKPHPAGPPGLLLVFGLVLLAHLLAAWLANGLLINWSLQASPEQLVSARLIRPPPARPTVPKPAARPQPPTKPPADVAAASSQTPRVQPLAQAPPQPSSITEVDLGSLEKAEGLRLSRPADLMPDQGAIPMQAYLGRYDQGGQLLGQGEIVMSYPTPAQYQVALTARALGWLSLLVSGEVGIKSE
ncbi:MAG: hypothetical protein EBT14_01515, partial [Betaproteobacteria bacterium]|nr:hypothetical protein [Betaproteobacteria bacterium]